MSQEFGAVLVASLAIFGLIFVATQTDFDFTQEPPPQQMVFFEENIGEIGDAESDSRTIRFDEFTVGEGRGDILAMRRERGEVRNKLLKDKVIMTEYNATQPQGGEITFEVLGSSGSGEVFVLVNGQRVFQEALVTGGTPEIEIPASALEVGNNRIVIGTTRNGFLSSSSYALEDIQIRVNDRKFHDYVDTFKMYKYELTDFLDAKLNFNIKDAVKPEPLNVFVNGENIYSLDRVRGQEEVTLTPQNADLHNGLNTIKFETDGEAVYTINNADITVRYVGKTSEALLRREFQLNRPQLEYAVRNNTQESIRFNYQNLLGSPREIIFDINGERHRLTPNNGRNTLNIRPDVLQEDNVMIIRSDGAFQLNQLTIRSEMVEN